MGGKANQRVAQALYSVRIFLRVGVPHENSADRLRPLADDSVKVLANHVGCRRTNFETFRGAAINQRSEQFAEQFFYRTQLVADHLEFCGSRFDSGISRGTRQVQVRRGKTSAEFL